MILTERLDGGLVTSRDPSLLSPGELAGADDVHLLPGSPSLHKVPGRQRWTTAAFSPRPIDGIGYAEFAAAQNRLVAVAGGSYFSGVAGDVGALASAGSGAGASLDVVMMNDSAVLLSGAGRNRVLLSDGTLRPRGLQPVTAPPGCVHTGAGGTFPIATGIYEYWTTEVYKSATDEIEGTFAGTPATVTVTSANSHVKVNRPLVVNSEATHWRVYRSIAKSSVVNQAFPAGFFIGEALIDSLSFEDGITTTTASIVPTTAVSGTPTLNARQHVSYRITQFSPWDIPGNAFATDAALANSGTVHVSTPSDIDRSRDYTVADLLLGGFAIPGNIGDPITDITVTVVGKFNTNAQASVTLSWDAGNNWTQMRTLPLTSAGLTTCALSGLWGRTWNIGELTAAHFMVAICADSFSVTGGSIDIDSCAITITHSGTTGAQTTVFPVVSVIGGLLTAPLGRNAFPPSASAGTLFQGALLTNDVDHPTDIVWTIPGTFDYAPLQYRQTLDGHVVAPRSLGPLCLIGLTSAVHRMNYLPVQEDPEFNTARAFDIIDTDDGFVSAAATCRFTMAGQPHLFYAGRTTLRMSNGFVASTATDDVLWPKLAAPSRMHECFCVNNATYQEILLWYFDQGGTCKCLRLSYHPSHLKDGKLKVAGITHYGPTCACEGVTDLGERVVYTGLNSHIYQENRGYADASGGSILPRASTREIHNAGLGGEWEVHELGVHHHACAGATLGVSYDSAQANVPVRTSAPQTYDIAERQLTVLGNCEAGGGITVNLFGADDGNCWDINYLLLLASNISPEPATLK